MWYWGLIEEAGRLMVLAWLATALPWIGLFVDIDWLGKFGPGLETEIIAYNGLFSVSGKSADYYFVAILLGIALAKFGRFIQTIGNNYRTRHIYMPPNRSGGPLGTWITAKSFLEIMRLTD
ncbi:MAG: hypothetical protein Q8P32_00045 [Candidatus Komeilibacteria bacterium]|nr:hypothetical protein [Candidatus Komeilibacteria bacterium]